MEHEAIMIRTTNDVSAKLKAVRFATAVVAKLDAKILADRLAMEDSLSKANEVGMRDNDEENTAVDEYKLQSRFAKVDLLNLEKI